MSAGLAEDSDSPIDVETVAWADRIFVMESRHRRVIERRFASALRSPVVTLRIRDEFQFMDETLIALLRSRMVPFLR